MYCEYRSYLYREHLSDENVLIGYYVMFECDKKNYSEFRINMDVVDTETEIETESEKSNEESDYTTYKKFVVSKHIYK